MRERFFRHKLACALGRNSGQIMIAIAPLIALLFLFSSILSARAETMSELRKRIEEKDAEIKALEAEAAKYQKSLNQAMMQSKTLRGEIARMDASIKQINYRLSIVRKQMDSTLLRIKALEGKIYDAERLIERRRTQIAHTIRTMDYIDQTGAIAILLKSDNVSDFFDSASALLQLEEGLISEMRAIQVLKKELETDRQEEKALEERQRALSEELKVQNLIEQSKKRDRTELLEKTRNQEFRYQQLLLENKKNQEKILKEIEELESDLRRLALKATVPPRQPGLFGWPIDNGYITQEYGETSKTGFRNDFYHFHNGIDFGAPSGIGTPIKAAADGIVTATGDNSPYAYGKWVTIEHKNGLTTLYAHLSLISTKVGKSVAKGEIIGYMGSTGFVTGPHLHFTVYATETFRVEKRWFGPLPLGGSLNPRDYLPAS